MSDQNKRPVISENQGLCQMWSTSYSTLSSCSAKCY